MVRGAEQGGPARPSPSRQRLPEDLDPQEQAAAPSPGLGCSEGSLVLGAQRRWPQGAPSDSRGVAMALSPLPERRAVGWRGPTRAQGPGRWGGRKPVSPRPRLYPAGSPTPTPPTLLGSHGEAKSPRDPIYGFSSLLIGICLPARIKHAGFSVGILNQHVSPSEPGLGEDKQEADRVGSPAPAGSLQPFAPALGPRRGGPPVPASRGTLGPEATAGLPPAHRLLRLGERAVRLLT